MRAHARRARLGLALLCAYSAAPIALATEEAKPAAWVCPLPAVPPLPPEPDPRETKEFGTRTRLRMLECEIERRKKLGLSNESPCYFGPAWVRMSPKREAELRKAHAADPVELWHALMIEPDDPDAVPNEVRVRSKSGPNCDPDYDDNLEREAAALRKELNFR
jgi:hypothetical protein